MVLVLLCHQSCTEVVGGHQCLGTTYIVSMCGDVSFHQPIAPSTVESAKRAGSNRLGCLCMALCVWGLALIVGKKTEGSHMGVVNDKRSICSELLAVAPRDEIHKATIDIRAPSASRT
jgi:hypothetical protein